MTPPAGSWAPSGSVISAFSALVHDSTEPDAVLAARTRFCSPIRWPCRGHPAIPARARESPPRPRERRALAMA